MDSDLRARIDALEARVAELEAARAAGAAERSPVARPEAWRQRPPARGARGPRREAPPGLRVRWAEAKSEDVLGKVGIALFLLGVLFLLREAVDRGWLTAAVRVAGAGAIGAALVASGMRLRRGRPVLGRLLTGGGIAALFGTLWTAGVLYPLLPAAVALAGMAAVAALALVLSLREDDAALSVVGALGALMTPLLLYREPGQMGLLMGYAGLVASGAAAVYWRKGWEALVGAAALGGWGVVLVAWVVGIAPEAAGAGGMDRTAFVLGTLAVFAATALVPLARAAVSARGAASPEAGAPEATRDGPFATWPSLLRPEALAVLVGPLAALGFVDGALRFTDWAFAGIAVALAAGAWAASREARPLAGALVLAAAALVAWGAGRLLGPDDARAAATAVALGCALVWTARRDRLPDVALVGHAVAMTAAVALVLLLTLAPGFPGGHLEPLAAAGLGRFSLAAALGAGALGLVGFTSRRGGSARGFHLTAAHVVVVAWLRVLLGPLANGTALTSAAWGVYGVALVVVGLRLADDLVRSIGLGTVLLTVAKVLIFDLAEVPALWRVLLFMGLGALLLLVSYLVPSLLRGRPEDAASGGAASGATGDPARGPGDPPPGDGLSEPPLPPVPASRAGA